MKSILSVLFFALAFISSFAQPKSDSSQHLTFKGVPIDGTLNDYVLKMKMSGFVHKGTEDGIAVLEGDFAAYKNCTIEVSTLKQTDLVSKIKVAFPKREDWSSLSENYFNLKELLTEKYGNPSENVENFQSYTPESDGSKMSAVKLDRCNYFCYYKTDNGTIQLSIENNRMRNAFVKLAYFDKINGEAVKKQALEDL